MDLFSATGATYEPLASRMRPRSLDEFIGQDHIVGSGRLLRRAIEADKLTSVLLSGPPGTGKTTLARVIAQTTRGAFLSVNAVFAGIKDIRDLIDKAQDLRRLHGRKTILFVDEVHRWNKGQQDALLPWVENGTFILIGATTENPFFEVNSALVSRSRIFQLRPLGPADLEAVARQALGDPVRGYGRYNVQWEAGSLEHLIAVASGDARTLLNAMELAVETSVSPFPPAEGSTLTISLDAAEQSIQRKAVLYDKDGDYHFDTVSALIKSIRGSDPDATLYWLARMVRAGEDPDFVFRRLLVSAAEDVGLADPQALPLVVAAAEAFRRVGLPEGQFHLSQAALYLATAAKSNSTLGYFEALKHLEREPETAVPAHLKDASRDGEAWGHGRGYQYPHAFAEHWVAQDYLPAPLRGQVFYQPSDQGEEGRRRPQVLRRRELVVDLAGDDPGTEVLTWTDDRSLPWRQRLESPATEARAALRDALFERAAPTRHATVWVASDNNGFLLLEALRRCPEGQVWGSLDGPVPAQALHRYLEFLPELLRPVLASSGWGHPPADAPARVDLCLAWGSRLAADWVPPVAAGLTLVVDPDPLGSTRLTSLIMGIKLTEAERRELDDAEEAFLRLRQPSPRPAPYTTEAFSARGRRELSRDRWAGWWTPRGDGRWADHVTARHPGLAARLAEFAQAWPGPEVDWNEAWTLAVLAGGPP